MWSRNYPGSIWRYLATSCCLRLYDIDFILRKRGINSLSQPVCSKMIHLYIEHLLNIRTLSIQASLSTVSNKETKATLSADGKLLTLSHEDETASIQLPINISPNRQSNVRFTIPAIPSKELSFRVQLEEKPGVQNGALSNGDHDSGNLVPWNADSLTAETEVYCGSCSAVMMEPGKVQTWKALPSQGWAEMMEFWHCHKLHEPHDHAAGEMKKGYAAGSKLAVESGVGLVDLVDFIFSVEDCSNFTVSLDFTTSFDISTSYGPKRTGTLAPHGNDTRVSWDTKSPKSNRRMWKSASTLRELR
jgi:ubiquitin-protein ligase E3 D